MTALTAREGLEPRLVGAKPSVTLALNEACAELARAGRPVARLGLGQSPFPVPPRIVAALRANAGQKDYLPVRGLPALRTTIASHLESRYGIARGAADVLVAPGSKELMFLLQVAFAGELVVPAPAWVSYGPQALIVGRAVRTLATRAEDGFCIDPDALDRELTAAGHGPRVLVLNSPSNPTGRVHSRDRLAAIADVARRHELIVLSDEIYAELHHHERPCSIASLYEEGTIVSTGLSKWCGAGGWRLGCFSFPERLRWLLDAMAVVASETYSATSAPIQYAAVEAFCVDAELEDYLARSRRVVRAICTESARRLRAMGAWVPEPEAAFYAFPGFGPIREALRARGIEDDRALASAFLEHAGVATLPGSEFGLRPDELYLRLALVDFDGSGALVAAAEETDDRALAERACRPVLDGLDRMRAFLAG